MCQTVSSLFYIWIILPRKDLLIIHQCHNWRTLAPLVWSLVCLCKYLINSPANVTPITRRPGHGVMGRLGGAEADINMMLVTVNQNTRTMAS